MRKQGIAGNEAAQNRLRNEEKLRLSQLNADMKKVMATPEGRRLIWHFLDNTAAVFSGSFTGNSETFFREGRRDVGISIMKLAQSVDPDAYVAMLQEQLATRREREVHLKDVERLANKEDEE